MKQTPLQIRYSVLEMYNFEQIADDLAIEFAEWILMNRDGLLKGQRCSNKYLLELFKRQKGL